LNCEMIWKIWKKGKLKCEMIWKIWKKGKSNSEKKWKIKYRRKLCPLLQSYPFRYRVIPPYYRA
jgi:hypothetical protein